jgi:hypothetical protein
MNLELLHQLWGERELLHTSMPLIHPIIIIIIIIIITTTTT